MDFIARLLGGLVSLVFDELNLDDIVHASHVSRKWRVHAQLHPTFYSNVIVYSHHDNGPPEALYAFFQARVSAAGTKTIAQLSIVVTARCAAVDRVFLPAVAQCLPRILRLVLYSEDCYASQVFDALSSPAPMLQSLKIRLHNTHDPIAQDPSSCPDDIFSGHAPQLRELEFSGTMWPRIRTPVPAFNCVSSIKTDYEALTFANPEVLFISCPALCDLVFLSYTVDETPQDVWDTCCGRCLRKLVIYGPSQMSTALNVTTADTEHVSFAATWANATTFDHIFQHFPNDIQMQVRCGSENLSVVLKDETRTRKVHWVDDELEELLVPSVFAPILSSITALSVGIETIFDIARIAPRFPNVITLVITPTCPEASTCEVQPLSFPALRRLEVEGPQNDSVFDTARMRRVLVHDLAHFMGHMLGCLPRRALTLVFRAGAYLEGDPHAVKGYFKEMVTL